MMCGRALLLPLFVCISVCCFFSSIAFAAGPAGVESGLQLWLSADNGVKDVGNTDASDGEQVETWLDQSAVGRDVSRDEGGALYSENGLNFNPTLVFDTDRYIADDTNLPSGSADRSIFVVASADSGGWRYVLGAGSFGGLAPAGSGFDFGHHDGNQKVFITTHNPQSAETGSWLPYGTARLAYGAASGTRLYIAVNGETPIMGTDAAINTLSNGTVKIGTNSRADEYWDGSISEVIFFDRLVNAVERQRINSYLALKYGFSLDQSTPQSYLASGSNLMWDKDAADASTYDNDLFGIGRDDASNLSQIKSRGQNSTTVITVEAVGEGTNLEPDFEDIDNLEFLVFGDNGGAASWTSTGAPAGYQVLERQWKKQEQGDVGFVNMDFDVANGNMNIPDTLDGGVYYFVYDSDNDGSLSDEVPQGMSDQGSDNWRVIVDFGSGGLFTLATTEGPAAESLSPVDNAVGVNGNTNLVITFSTAVTVETGNILIKRASDDSIVETISVGSGQVTGSGTDTITINPTNDLAGGVEYYVQVPNTAFKDGDDDYFPGITNTTGWSFTTGDFSGPVISDVEAIDITSSSSTITWTTDENASSRVLYGLTTAYGSSTSETDTSPRVTSHSVGVSSLSSCTTYHFRVVSRDASGNSATSSDATFTTLGCPETEESGGGNGIRVSMAKSLQSNESEVPYSDDPNLLDATVCSPYIKTYIRYGADNDPGDVKKLETFLNEKQGESLVIDGIYNDADVEAVKRFQQKYAAEVLDVWGLSEPTGYIYRTTLMKINSFYCSASITCPAFAEYNSLTENSVSEEVVKTKTLLSELGFYTGMINNVFDTELNTSLRSFQETFSETMLKPWGLAYGTGYKYKTTNKFLNMLVGCQTPAVELDGGGTFDY